MENTKTDIFISFAGLEGMKVLIVDDNPESLGILKSCFEDTGLQVLIAKSGVSALNIAARTTPDLILLDIMMEGMDGFQICEKLKGNRLTKDTPIIFVTGKNAKKDFVRGFSVGAADFINKPVCQEEVLARAKNQLVLRKELSAKNLLIRKAQNSDQAKSEFMAKMSHELRTPMNAILGFGQLLKIDAQKEESKVKTQDVERILKAGKHLLELINEVLDLSRIEAGKLKVSLEPVNLFALKSEILDIISPLIEEKGVQIVDEDDANDNVFVTADKVRLRQVLLNLFSNAIKYSRMNGTITMETFRVDDRLRFFISNMDREIPEKFQRKPFEPSEKAGNEFKDIQESSIGFQISKRLMNLMSGSIGFKSREGEGNGFFIEIPLASIPDMERQTVDSIKSLAIEEGFRSSSKTILYIEDNSANLHLVKRILSIKEGVKLVSATEAESGIQIALSEKPALILMDINLPGMSGGEAFRKLKSMEKTANIPIIAVSADAMANDKKKALDMGFKSYITKPIDIDSFFKEINNFV